MNHLSIHDTTITHAIYSCYTVDLGSLEVWLNLIHFLSHTFLKKFY